MLVISMWERIQVKTIPDERGNLAVVEAGREFDGNIGRCDLYSSGMNRGNTIRIPAETGMMLIALSGSAMIEVGSDQTMEKMYLNTPVQAIRLKGGHELVQVTMREHSAILALSVHAVTHMEATEKIDFIGSTVDSCTIRTESAQDAGGSGIWLRSIRCSSPRIYYLFDVPECAERGGHAHMRLYQQLVIAAGSCELYINDGVRSRHTVMTPQSGTIEIVPGIWRELKGFKEGTVVFVIASEKYDEADYFRDYTEYVTAKHGRQV